MEDRLIPEVGSKAPAFALENQDGDKCRLSGLTGSWVVLYFYPKDDTPGCTIEACDFSNGIKSFEKLDAVVIGISPDSIESHRKFIAKHKLKVTLLSDPEHSMMQKYGAWGKKMNYGKEYLGVIRSTFLIDPKGKVAALWANARAKGHAEKVEQRLAELSAS